MGELFYIVSHNFAFWAMLGLVVIFGVVRKFMIGRDFSIGELAIYGGVNLILLFLFFLIFYSTTTNIRDFCVFNGQVVTSEYYEEWTEECEYTTTDSDGNTTTHTYYVYYPPYWQVNLNYGESIGISRDSYEIYRNLWGNEHKVNLIRLSQSSSGDGDKYVVNFVPGKRIVPASSEHIVVNYLKGSHYTVRKRFGSIPKEDSTFLRPYPRVYSGSLGPIEFNRVVLAGARVPPGFSNCVDHLLDQKLCQLGPSKEINIIVYFVGTNRQEFFHSLEESWVTGKKNDLIVVIGSQSWPRVDWATVMGWTKAEALKVNIKNRIIARDSLVSPDSLVSDILGEVCKAPSNGGWIRTEMKDLRYLTRDIKLPWWAQLIIIVVTLAADMFLVSLFAENDII